VELGEITLEEVTGNSFTTAIIPVGSCEVHGNHLPYGSDTLIALGLARRVAALVPNVLIVPPITYGMSWHHGDLPMTLSFSPETMVSAILDIAGGLRSHGVRHIMVINGHDGNVAPIEIAARRFRQETGDNLLAFATWWEAIPRLVPEGRFEAWSGYGHGGEAETSLNLAIRPDLVHQERASGQELYVPLEFAPLQVRYYGHFGEHSKTGYCGDATKASAEKGDAALDAMARHIADFLADAERVGVGWITGRPGWDETPPTERAGK
jgi:creatinine amidohydrolase